MLDDPQHRLIAGIVMLAAAVLIAVAAVFMGYAGATRWLAINAIQDTVVERFGDKERAAQMAAKTAAKWAPDAASAVLPGVDLLDPASDEQLAALEQRAEPRYRDAVRTARELGRLQRGEELAGGSVGGIDGSLLDHIVQLRAQQGGQLPSMPEGGRFEAPNALVLRYAIEERLAASWRSGDAQSFADAAGNLLQIDPTHPVAPQALIANRLFDTELNVDLLNGEVRRMQGDPQLPPFARRLARLAMRRGGADAPARAHAILEHVPLADYDADELRLWLQAGNHSLTQLVQHARRSKDRGLVMMAVAKALEMGEVEAIRSLSESLPEAQRKRVELHLAQRQWQLDRIVALDGENSRYLPRVRTIRIGGDELSFHVCNDFGASPPDLELELGDAAPQVRRAGSLLSCALPPARPLRLRVRLGKRTIFDEVLAP